VGVGPGGLVDGSIGRAVKMVHLRRRGVGIAMRRPLAVQLECARHGDLRPDGGMILAEQRGTGANVESLLVAAPGVSSRLVSFQRGVGLGATVHGAACHSGVQQLQMGSEMARGWPKCLAAELCKVTRNGRPSIEASRGELVKGR
jgi:hypothetical protein